MSKIDFVIDVDAKQFMSQYGVYFVIKKVAIFDLEFNQIYTWFINKNPKKIYRKLRYKYKIPGITLEKLIYYIKILDPDKKKIWAYSNNIVEHRLLKILGMSCVDLNCLGFPIYDNLLKYFKNKKNINTVESRVHLYALCLKNPIYYIYI